MADNKERELNPSRGNEWEVVSLTASTYAAAPGPKPVELNDDGKENSDREDKGETSQAMFMSRHFDFPQSQPENFPVEPENLEISNELSGEDATPELVAEQGGVSDVKDDGNWNTKKGLSDDFVGIEKFDASGEDAGPDLVAEEGGVSDVKDDGNWNIKKGLSDDFMGIEIFDDKGESLSVSGTKFDELQRLNLANKEQSIYNTMEFSTFSNEENMEGSTIEENRVFNEPIEPSDQGLDSYISNLEKHVDEDKDDGTEIPCEGWWKRRAASLYNHVKETNAMWSIFFAAAVMGLVILGQRWQQEKRRDLQLKWEFGINGQKTGRIVGPLCRFKDVIVGGTPRGSFISGGISTEL